MTHEANLFKVTNHEGDTVALLREKDDVYVSYFPVHSPEGVSTAGIVEVPKPEIGHVYAGTIGPILPSEFNDQLLGWDADTAVSHFEGHGVPEVPKLPEVAEIDTPVSETAPEGVITPETETATPDANLAVSEGDEELPLEQQLVAAQ